MLKKHVSLKQLSSWFSLPWFDKKAKAMVQRKQKLYKRVEKSGKPEQLQEFVYFQINTNFVGVAPITADGKLHSDSAEKADLLNNQF